MDLSNDVWRRIQAHEGEEFRQIRGKSFTYHVKGSMIVLQTTNHSIARSDIERALLLVPLSNTVPVQHLRGPSFIYAILMDRRIRLADW